jgi:hypothetical protein
MENIILGVNLVMPIARGKQFSSSDQLMEMIMAGIMIGIA